MWGDDSLLQEDGFNTQPPEGGWPMPASGLWLCLFQHTAARRRLGRLKPHRALCSCVSTHSRPKAAGESQGYHYDEAKVSTHSRPKAAGPIHVFLSAFAYLFQHTAARRRLEHGSGQSRRDGWFQHTAARRRLESGTGFVSFA